jgi:DNA-binding response OmpR family regulator
LISPAQDRLNFTPQSYAMNKLQSQTRLDVDSAPAQPSFEIVEPVVEPVVVVIAEDDPISRTLVTAVVERGGFHTIVTRDGNEAMAALRERDRPCVAVLDWMMPGMDGAEVCRRTRESGRNVYIIMLTACSSKEETVQGMDNGADDYMTKPFHAQELLARIRAGVRQINAEFALQVQIEQLHDAVTETKIMKFQLASTHTQAPAILVLNDDSAIQALFEIYLSSFGYRVLVARDADEALRMVSVRSDIRALILDGVTGQQLAAKARSALPGLGILFCSDRSLAALKSAGIDVTGETFLQTPYLPADLKQKMAEVLA